MVNWQHATLLEIHFFFGTMQTRSGKQISEQQSESRQVPVCINDHVDNLSCPGSHVSSSKSSLSRVTSAKSSLLRAQLKEKQLRQELELEKKLLKARHDVEMAELHVKLAADDEQNLEEYEGGSVIDNREQLERYVKDCAEMVGRDAPITIGKNAVVEKLDMPKVEMSYFDGNCTDYLRFTKEFEYYVENRVKDPGQRMLYLLHYCKGRAKAAIHECVILRPESAYARAKVILQDLFGEIHVIARNRIEDMIRSLRPVAEDGEALSRLSIQLQNCLIALTEMNYLSDLNSVTTLERIVRILPIAVRRNWARLADAKNQEGQEPSFQDLCHFVSTEARVARSRYGHLVSEGFNRPNAQVSINRQGRQGSTSFAIQGERTPALKRLCILCRSDHATASCQKFVGLDVRDRWSCVRRHRACFLCLEVGHRIDHCVSGIKCSKAHCSGKHHPLLHVEPIVNQVAEQATCAATMHYGTAVMLGVIPVKVRAHGKEIDTYAFLDNGSDVTLVTRDLLSSLGLEGTPSSMTLTTINGASQLQGNMCELEVASMDENEMIKLDRVFALPSLPVNAPSHSISQEARRWPHLQELPFRELDDKRVTMLIGCDVPEAHWVLDQRLGSRKQPYAIKTLLGWVLLGPLHGNTKRGTVNYARISEESIKDDIRRLYEAEFRDTEENEHSFSIEDRKAIELVTQSTVLEKGHYIIPLPWKDPAKVTDNNYVVAINRLLSLKRRLSRDKNLLARYVDGINTMLKNGYALPVPPEQLAANYRPRWYLPHHPVMNPKKPDKLRIVLDCAATFRGYSLNDKLYQGPDTIAELVGVLLRFREKPIAVVADIADMFMQVKVPVGDRGALRFLWWKNGCLDEEPQEFQMTAHPFGATSSPFCANFALRKTVEDFGCLYPETVRDIVRHNFYVDDCLACFEDVETASRFITDVSDLLSSAGFRLHEWIANRAEVLKSVTLKEPTPTSRLINGDTVKVERTLGLEWNSEIDCFVFPFKIPRKPVTRRGILSAVSSIFDPLGILSPLLLPAKLMLQSLCKQNMGWDQSLSSQNEEVWQNWIGAVERIAALRIPRCIGPSFDSENCTQQLHILCDASEVGYGAAAYVRVQSSDNKVYCNLLFAKARVAPLKAVTIPRLELVAAVLAIRLYEIIRRNTTVKFKSVYFWTDSMTVLYYIRDTSTRFSTFVANRLATIHHYSDPKQWYHVPTRDNTADLASRGTLKLEQLQRWLEGPRFLSKEEHQWPHAELCCIPETIELKKQTAAVQGLVRPDCITNLLRRYSKWTLLVKSFAWILRWKTFLVERFRKTGKELEVTGLLKLSEMRHATLEIIRSVQSEVYSNFDEIGTDRNYKGVNSLRKLCPIVKDGVLCVGGRLSYADISMANKHPAILPSKHIVTEILIQHYHAAEGHCGVHHVLASLRRSFWIVKGASTVKRVIGQCVECKRRSTLTCEQLMAPLPMARVQEGWYPFQFVGVDYFGPFFVKRGRGKEKRYGCLFTCLQIRAIHLEVAHSLTTESFIMSLLRFIARHGTPTDMYSDNGTNFVGANRELKELVNGWNQKKINDTLLSKEIQWHFQPPNASHRGGVWERMIRSVRAILQALCNEQNLNDESILTFMAEVERILNDRPLVPSTSDSRDNLALTPNHLLLVGRNISMETPSDTVQVYNSGWRQAMHLAALFWRRWKREYLPVLQTRQKWTTKSKNLSPGDW